MSLIFRVGGAEDGGYRSRPVQARRQYVLISWREATVRDAVQRVHLSHLLQRATNVRLFLPLDIAQILKLFQLFRQL